MGVVYLGHDRRSSVPSRSRLCAEGRQASSDELKEGASRRRSSRADSSIRTSSRSTRRAEGELLYIAMEYVDGDPLTRIPRVAAGHPHAARAGRSGAGDRSRARARARAGCAPPRRQAGNILMTREHRVKVADFGIGKLLRGTADLTRHGPDDREPGIHVPEQVRGEKLDGRSDFFSLGVVFYELLTGSRPFPGDSITTLVYQILHTEPRDPLEVRADLPPAAREVFARLLAKSPDKRPSNAQDFLREVRRIGDQLGEVEQTLAFSGAAPAVAPVSASSDDRPTRPSTISGPAPPLPPPPVSPSPAPPVLPVPPPATSGPPASPAPAPAGRGGAHLLLFGLAAVLLAVAALLVVWRRSRASETASLSATSTTPSSAGPASRASTGAPAAPSPNATPDSSAGSIPSPSPTLGSLPTPGPPAAADAVVGAPRFTTPGPTRVPRPTATLAPRVAVAPPPPPEPPAESRHVRESSGPIADATYRTRKYAKIGVSPDQARMYVDGRFVGIADDWDDRGGGRKFEFIREGVHRVRFELPGYHDLNVDVTVSGGADDDTADIGDELRRESRVAYPKIGGITDRTVGPVVLRSILRTPPCRKAGEPWAPRRRSERLRRCG